jgi:hypothetical protein
MSTLTFVMRRRNLIELVTDNHNATQFWSQSYKINLVKKRLKTFKFLNG